MDQPLFLLQGAIAADTDLLGLWQPLPQAAAFTAESAGDPPLVWQVALPDDLAQAADGMAQQRAALAATEQALLAARLRLAQLDPRAAASFAAGDPLEAALLGTLLVLRRGAATPESFGLLGRVGLPEKWQEDAAAYRAFVERTLRLLRPQVVVETTHMGLLIARSTLDLDGDARVVLAGDGAALARLHVESVSVALRSRRALLQLLGQVGAGAVGLASRFALPGGALTALPAAYRYMRAVIAQARLLTDAAV